jgi:hypothetical protein
VKRRLSRKIETTGRASPISRGDGIERSNVIAPGDGGGSTKKSLERTFAVICEGAEGTQEVFSLPGIRGTRLARTMTREKVQIHTAARCTRFKRHGRGIRGEAIGTLRGEGSLSHSFYTHGAERKCKPFPCQKMRARRQARVSKLLVDCVFTLTACRRRRRNRWRSAYRRGRQLAWGHKLD